MKADDATAFRTSKIESRQLEVNRRKLTPSRPSPPPSSGRLSFFERGLSKRGGFYGLFALVFIACGSSYSDDIVRRMGGERHVGKFVSPFSYEWYVRGELAAAQGDLQFAVEAFRMALAGPEEDAYVYARLADVLDRLNQNQAADRALAAGEQLDPRSEAIWLTRGQIAERRGDVRGAIDAYSRAEACAPRESEAPLALARLLRAQGAGVRADAILSRYVLRVGTANPSAARVRLSLALSRGDSSAAAEAVESLISAGPARASEIHAAADAALSTGNAWAAVRLLSLLPDGARDNRLYVQALIESDRLAKAEAVLSSEVPERLGGLLSMARLYLAVGRPDRAEELASAATAVEGSQPEAQLVLGKAKLEQGRYAEAAEVFARIPEGVSTFVEARMELVDALRSQGLSGLAAEVLSDTLRRTSGDEQRVRFQLALLRMTHGNVAAAKAAIGRADSPLAQAALAKISDLAGNAEEAARQYGAIRSEDAALLGEADRERARAEHFVSSRKLPQAIVVLSSRVERAPEDIAARTRLIELLLASGRANEAKQRAAATLQIVTMEPFRRRLRAVLSQSTAP